MDTGQGWIANVAILNKILAKESWYNTFFAKFSGNVDISQDENGNNVYNPSGRPIEMLTDYVAQGRDNMLIPFLKELNGDPVYGDTVLKGTGEDQVMNWLRCYVNQTRKAVMKRSGQMSEQRQRIYRLYDAARPQLSRWYTKFENQSIWATFYEGVSPSLSAGTTDDGLGLVKRYHPNWYVSDGGVLTAVGTEKSTKTAAQLDTADTAADTAMTAAILRSFRTKLMELRIPTMTTKDGHKFWCMVIHPAQWEALQGDTVFQNAQREAYSGRALDNPELTGAVAYYSGFAIYEDIVGIRGWDSGNDDLGFNNVSSMFSPTDVTDNYNAIVFGNSAVGKGIADGLHFTSEIDDHENTIEIGAAAINGYNRNDYFIETDSAETTGDAFYKDNVSPAVSAELPAINQSSAVLMTT